MWTRSAPLRGCLGLRAAVTLIQDDVKYSASRGNSFREKRLGLAQPPASSADPYRMHQKKRPSTLQGIGADPVVEHGPDGWTKRRAPDGRDYFHHDVIGTQFERPIGFDLETGGGDGIPGTTPLALLTPNSRRQQIKRILSWQKHAEGEMAESEHAEHAEDNGTYCEHVLTCRCDWLDWSCLCSQCAMLVGAIILIVCYAGDNTQGSLFLVAVLMLAVPTGLWALCVGVPYIAFNTTLGRSRWGGFPCVVDTLPPFTGISNLNRPALHGTWRGR